MKYRYIGETFLAFEKDGVYEAEYEPKEFGECYAIRDESGDWYLYSAEFFKENFVPFTNV